MTKKRRRKPDLLAKSPSERSIRRKPEATMAKSRFLPKITTRHRTIIPELYDVLARIAEQPEVQAIHTGPYRAFCDRNPKSHPRFRLREVVPSGLDFGVRGIGGVQVIRIVTGEPDTVLDFLRRSRLFCS